MQIALGILIIILPSLCVFAVAAIYRAISVRRQVSHGRQEFDRLRKLMS